MHAVIEMVHNIALSLNIIWYFGSLLLSVPDGSLPFAKQHTPHPLVSIYSHTNLLEPRIDCDIANSTGEPVMFLDHLLSLQVGP
jgi:hypothetical protein